MNNRFLTTITLLASSTLFVTGCSNDSPFETSNTTGINELAPVSDVVTQIADQNSFSISREKTAVDALNYEGVTSEVTVRAADRHNNPVPDNTAVKFLTNGGRIEPQCLTLNGECTVTWTEQLPTPDPSFKAIILAYTTGEESFTDLNDNDMYDDGEFFTDNSEPFFDINENGVRNASTEEFVDADNDMEFDTADGLFTGTPCVGDNTVCNRISTLIWNTTDILLSGSYATISITGSLPTVVDSSSFITIEAVDVNGNAMPDGTTVEISSSKGTVDPTTWNFAPRGTQFDLVYTTGNTDGIIETLKIEVTTPLGATTVAIFPTVALAP